MNKEYKDKLVQLYKKAQAVGLLQESAKNVTEYKNRYDIQEEQMNLPKNDPSSLYGVFGEQPDYKPVISEGNHALSSRYAPDMPGVQASVPSDGVRVNPYTKQVFDYNQGFKTNDGRNFSPTSVSNQTKIFSR
jgi:hypothetical protein